MTLKRDPAIAVLTVTVLSFVIAPASAADKWIEVKSPHVTVISSNDERDTPNNSIQSMAICVNFT